MEQAVLVEQRPHRVPARAQYEGVPAGIDLPFRRPGGHPVLEAVDGQRQLAVTVRHYQQPWDAQLPKFGQPLRVSGPSDDLDVHEADGRGYLLRPCYPPVTYESLPVPRSVADRSAAAAATAAPKRRPGCNPSRSIGPLTLTAAATTPGPSKTGALTLATPASRSPTLAAHPRRRTDASSRAVMSNRAASVAQARRTLPPEPRSSGSTAPRGTVSRRPLGRSCTATQTRWSASRT